MIVKLEKFLKKIVEWGLYLFIFLLPWQTKLILRPAAVNFKEVGLYVSHLLLLAILILFFVYKLKKKESKEKITLTWLALLGTSIFILVSFFFSSDQVLSFYHYFLFLLGIGLFCLLREEVCVIDGYGCLLNKTKIIFSFLAGIFLQAVLGIYQFLTQSSFACKYLGLAQHDSGTLGTAVVEAASGRWLRAYGGFDHPNIFGGVLAISLVLAAYLLARKKMITKNREITESILIFIFYFVSLFALFFSFSRAAWLAYGVGLLILLAIFIFQRDRWAIGRFLVLMFFSIIMILIVAIPYQDLLQARINGEMRLEQKSLNERKEQLFQARDMIQENLLFGVGVGNYVAVLEKGDGQAQEPWNYQPVHDVFLLLWAQSGVFALAGFLIFLLSLTIKKNRRRTFPLAILGALAVLMLLDHWLLSLPFGVLFLFLILGLL